jgi:hypothetical protein
MELRTCDHLKEDGVYGNSPALRGRNYYRCSRPNLRGLRLKRPGRAHNSLRLNILPASLTGSIFCGDFRLSPPVFSRFYEQGEGGMRHLSANRKGTP